MAGVDKRVGGGDLRGRGDCWREVQEEAVGSWDAAAGNK